MGAILGRSIGGRVQRLTPDQTKRKNEDTARVPSCCRKFSEVYRIPIAPIDALGRSPDFLQRLKKLKNWEAANGDSEESTAALLQPPATAGTMLTSSPSARLVAWPSRKRMSSLLT